MSESRMRCDFRIIAIVAMMVLILSACGTLPATPYPAEMSLNTPENPGIPCEACDQATLAAKQNNADNQAAATAAIVRANAQATLNSANATLSAAQTQEQSNANVIAAQIASTAKMERANAQATLNSAGATQSAALTQDAIQQTQMAALATTNAEALAIQQNKNKVAASTQTAVANNIATQTQVAVATSQWYSDQERQRKEQRQGPITFVWMFCLPLLAILVFFGVWRWLKNRQVKQFILEYPVDRLPAPTINDRYQHVISDDQVSQWIDEVKRELIRRDKEDEGNETDS